VTTRNARLPGIHSLFGYAALHCPEHACSSTRAAIPSARHTQRRVLPQRAETDALLAAPTGPAPSAAVTTSSCWSPSKPGCESPNSPPSPAPTPNSARAASAMRRKGPQAALHPVDQSPPPGSCNQWITDAAPHHPIRSSRPSRRAPQPRRHRRPADQVPSDRAATCPTLTLETHHPAHAAHLRGRPGLCGR